MSDMDPLYQSMKASAQDMSEASVEMKGMMTADENTDIDIKGYGAKPSFSKQIAQKVQGSTAGIFRLYSTLEMAQNDITNIPDGATVYVVNTSDSKLADEYVNSGGTLIATGRSSITQEYVDEAMGVITERFTVTQAPLEAISLSDSIGRKAVFVDENGITHIAAIDGGMFLSSTRKDGWAVVFAEDINGQVACGIDTQGRLHGFFVDHTVPNLSPPPTVSKQSRITVTPNQFEGATQHDRIMSALAFLKKFNGYGTLFLGEDTISTPATRTWILNSALPAHSRLTLALDPAGCKLKLADGVFDNIIRSDGIIVDPSNPNGVAQAINEMREFKITGDKSTCSIEGPDVPYTAPHPINGGTPVPWVGDWYGWRTIGILLANCKDYELTGFTMRKTTGWGISQERGCDGMHLHDIGFDTTVKNGDGIDFRMGCSNGIVENISGSTADDTVAMTALLGFQKSYPAGNYIWPLQVSGDAPSPLGNNIENISVRNVRSSSLHNQVRVLATNGAKIRNISISDIEDTGNVVNTQVLVETGTYGSIAVLGEVSNITVNGVISNYSNLPLSINTPIKDSQFNYIRQHKAGGQVYKTNPAYPMVNTTITNAVAE